MQRVVNLNAPVIRLYVVSDLHLGGPPGRQLFDQGDALAKLIDEAAASARKRESTLFVLNGDVFDFLAEEDPRYFDPDRAPERVRRIASDDAFRAVFESLRQFVAEPSALLAVVLGNHDVELAMPETLEAFREVSGCEGEFERKLVFALEELWCSVAGARVIIAHGNHDDSWNVVDIDALRRSAALPAGPRRREVFQPNGGTRLVVDVINKLQKNHPFVSFLKPEEEAVGTVLVSVPSSASEAVWLLPAFLRALGYSIYAQRRMAMGTLGGPGSPAPASGARAESVDALWDSVRQAEHWGVEPWQMVPDATGTLGKGTVVLSRFKGLDAREALRRGLDEFAGDDTFEIKTVDKYYCGANERYGDAEFLIVGHTHLARSHERHERYEKNKECSCDLRTGHYFNTGTWMSLIEVTKEWLEDKNYPSFYERLMTRTLGELREPTSYRGANGTERRSIVMHRPTYALIEDRGGHALGRLMERRRDAAKGWYGHELDVHPKPPAPGNGEGQRS